MTHFNRGATFTEEVQLPDDPLIDLLAQTNAKVEHFDLSADGQKIAYTSAESGGYDLWVCDIDGGNNRRVVAMYPEECLNPSWSPDGEWIAYTSRYDAFKVRADGSEPPINLSYGHGPSRGHEFIRWTPDGKRIVYVTGGSNGYNQVVSLPTDIPTGKVQPHFITNEEANSTDVFVSPDGKHVTFMSDRSVYEDFKRMDVWIAPIEGGQARNVTPNTMNNYEYRPRWSPDSKKLLFTSDRSGWRRVGIIDIESGDITFLTDEECDQYNPRFSPDGKWVAYVANKEWSFHIMKVASDGSGPPIQLTHGDSINGGFDAYQVRGSIRWTPDSKSILYTHMDHANTSDLYVISADGGEPKRVTHHMPQALEDFPFVKSSLIRYKSKDGLEVPAWLYRPANSEGRTPLVIYARANTKGLHVRGFYPYIQYWVHKGYSVIAPLVRGSAGLGKQYEFLNFGDWGGGDIDDFAYGAYHLIEQGLADPGQSGDAWRVDGRILHPVHDLSLSGLAEGGGVLLRAAGPDPLGQVCHGRWEAGAGGRGGGRPGRAGHGAGPLAGAFRHLQPGQDQDTAADSVGRPGRGTYQHGGRLLPGSEGAGVVHGVHPVQLRAPRLVPLEAGERAGLDASDGGAFQEVHRGLGGHPHPPPSPSR